MADYQMGNSIPSNSSGNVDWSSILGPAGSILGGYLAGNTAGDAASAVNSKLGQVITQQGGVLGNINNLYTGQRAVGNAGTTGLSQLLNPGTASSYLSSLPGYQFQLSQGDQAINRGATANGTAYTPNNQAYLSQYNQGLAGTTYNNYVSQLLSAAGLGNSANQTLTGANLTTGNNVAQAMVGQGNANASGVLGAGGGYQSMLGGIGNLANNFLNNNSNTSGLLNNLFGGGANGGLDASQNADLENWVSQGLFSPSGAGGQAAGQGATSYGLNLAPETATEAPVAGAPMVGTDLGSTNAAGVAGFSTTGAAAGAGAGGLGALTGADIAGSAGIGGDAALTAGLQGYADAGIAGLGATDAGAGAGAAAAGGGAMAALGPALGVAAPLALALYGMSTPPYTLNSAEYGRMNQGLLAGLAPGATPQQQYSAAQWLGGGQPAGKAGSDFGQQQWNLLKQYGITPQNISQFANNLMQSSAVKIASSSGGGGGYGYIRPS